ncbi:AAA family ATPase [Nocardioides sp. NPDC057767]|uniref:AAA family ATPase n=1 Tax=unclassified Nocardioides TaxID=2615069 RepID=UPI00366FF145
MLRRNRADVPVPPSLTDSGRLRDAQAAAEVFFRSRTTAARQSRFEFDDRLLERPDVRRSLERLFQGLCAFCSTAVGPDFVVHRFRPPQDSLGDDAKVHRRHYYWLAYRWSNLYAACTNCVQSQGQQFPVEGKRLDLGRGESNSSREERQLLDPCADDPEQELVYLPSGEVAARRDRGRRTIEVFSLNREDLVTTRQRVIEQAISSFEVILRAYERGDYLECAAGLEDAYSESRPFAAAYRQYVHQRVMGRRRQFRDVLEAVGIDMAGLVLDLPRITSADLKNFERRGERRPPGVAHLGSALPIDSDDSHLVGPPSIPARPRKASVSDAIRRSVEEVRRGPVSVALNSVHIENFKRIRAATFEIGAEPGEGRWTALLGDNGTGKTSTLQAIAIALAGPERIQALGISPQDLLRQGSRSGSIMIEFADRRFTTVRFDNSGFEFEGSFTMPVAGYGATRLPGQTRSRDPRPWAANIENLFDPFVALANTSHWVPELDDETFNNVGSALRDLLQLEDNQYVSRDRGGQIVIVDGRRRFEISQLSSGYQAVTALGLDMMRVFIQHWGHPRYAEGIVLIDEIEAHLHPRWQMQVVQTIRETFPRAQFVVTTHSPLCLRGLSTDEIRVLRGYEHDEIRVDSEVPAMAGMSIDQMLTSETFGLRQTIDPEIEVQFDNYYELLAQDRRSAGEEHRLSELQQYLAEHQQLGTTRRERIMLETIDRLLAEEQYTPVALDIELRPETRQMLEQIWQHGGS